MRPTCFSLLYVESDFGKTDTTDKSVIHSIYSSPVEALNLIVDSKSQPVDLDSSTAVKAKEKLAITLFCLLQCDLI